MRRKPAGWEPTRRPEQRLRSSSARLSDEVGLALDALVEIARGIHPAILAQGGLELALQGLVRRSQVPVELATQIDRLLADAVEVAAYYVVSEALTNVAKHAQASDVRIEVTTNNGALTLTIRDDGIGGAALGKARVSSGSRTESRRSAGR